MPVEVKLSLDNCMDCPFHLVQNDPDPNDWFNDDDEKVICKKTGRAITWACRPYNKRKECGPPPEWCPYSENKN